MADLKTLCGYLEEFAPPVLAEEWDNVGLLVAHTPRALRRIMTCLTVTPASVEEAIREKVDVIVTHHPFPFRPLKRLTNDSTVGRLLLRLIRHDIAIYSPHTAFDSAERGINQHLAEAIGLLDIRPLIPSDAAPQGAGSGRWGRLAEPCTLRELGERLKLFLQIDHLGVVGPGDRPMASVAIGCGSAGQFVSVVASLGCDALVLGETNFHTCLEAEASSVSLLLTGHYASERFAVELLAERLQRQFPDLTVWASRDESDPIGWV